MKSNLKVNTFLLINRKLRTFLASFVFSYRVMKWNGRRGIVTNHFIYKYLKYDSKN